MNKQKKVLITITYNEMGIIIDTKAEEVAQPNLQPTCNQLATTERDLISRQEVLGKKELVELEDGQSFYCISPEDVKKLPPVTPQQKYGKWIERESGTEDKENGFETVTVCSCCDFPATTFYSEDCESRTQIRTHFCPNCGAKMQEKKNDR